GSGRLGRAAAAERNRRARGRPSLRAAYSRRTRSRPAHRRFPCGDHRPHAPAENGDQGRRALFQSRQRRAAAGPSAGLGRTAFDCRRQAARRDRLFAGLIAPLIIVSNSVGTEKRNGEETMPSHSKTLSYAAVAVGAAVISAAATYGAMTFVAPSRAQ